MPADSLDRFDTACFLFIVIGTFTATEFTGTVDTALAMAFFCCMLNPWAVKTDAQNIAPKRVLSYITFSTIVSDLLSPLNEKGKLRYGTLASYNKKRPSNGPINANCNLISDFRHPTSKMVGAAGIEPATS
jgi:hypothetical protein